MVRCRCRPRAGADHERAERQPGEQKRESETSKSHGPLIRYTGEVLTGQGEMGPSVDSKRAPLISSTWCVGWTRFFRRVEVSQVVGKVPMVTSSFSARVPVVVCGLAFWRYWTTAEEASALA